MADARSLTRVLDELLWSLRREGIAISTAQAIDAARAARLVGFAEKLALKEALAAIVVHRARDRSRFDAVFEAFFAPGARAAGSLWERLTARGFSEAEVDAVRGLLVELAATDADAYAPLGAMLERGADLDRLLTLAGAGPEIEATNRFQLGFLTYRLLERAGAKRAHDALALLRSKLREALGDDRGAALADALRSELDATTHAVRESVVSAFERREQRDLERPDRGRLESTAFTSLSGAEIDEVRRAVRRFAERLRGGARVRERRALKGRIDPHRTLRRAFATGGVPFKPARKIARRDRPRLILVCDVSDSVRAVATFMLEFVYAAQELFERTRSFVFVSELGETTRLFAEGGISAALGAAYGGRVISVADNSNYGRVLRAFEARVLPDLDRRTTVVILGDGRNNYHDAAAEVLDRIRERSRALVWLCPESRAEWGVGDSAMGRYAPKCTEVYEVRSARDLEDAARALVTRR